MNDDDDDDDGFMNSLQRMFFLILMDYFIVLIAMIHFLLLVCRLNIIIKLIIIITFINRLQTHLQTEHNVITPCSYSSAFTSSQHTPRREESVSQDSIDQLLLVNNQSLNTFQLNPSSNQYPITTTSNEHEHEHEHEYEHDEQTILSRDIYSYRHHNPLTNRICVVLISNSTYKEFRASAMGIGQMFAGLFRFLGPFFLPIVFSWSTNINRFPLHFGFSYYVRKENGNENDD